MDKQLSRWAREGATSVLMFGQRWDVRGATEVSVDFKRRRVVVANPWSSPMIHQKIENQMRRAAGRSARPSW